MPLVAKAQSAIRAHHDVTLLLSRAKENRGRPPFRSATRNRSHSAADGCFSSISATPAAHVDPIRFEATLRQTDVSAHPNHGVSVLESSSARPPFRSSSRHAGIPSREYSREAADPLVGAGGHDLAGLLSQRSEENSGAAALLQEREVSVRSRCETPMAREVQTVSEAVKTSCSRRYEDIPRPRAMRLQLRAPFRPSAATAEARSFVPTARPVPSSISRKQPPRRSFSSAEVFLRVAPGSFCASGIPAVALEKVLDFIPDSAVPLVSIMSAACLKHLSNRLHSGVINALPKDAVPTAPRDDRNESAAFLNLNEPSIGYWSALTSYVLSSQGHDLPRPARLAMVVAAGILENGLNVLHDSNVEAIARLIHKALESDAAAALKKLSCAGPISPSVRVALREFIKQEASPCGTVERWAESFDAVDNTAVEFLLNVTATLS